MICQQFPPAACLVGNVVSVASNPVYVAVCVVVGEGRGICLRAAGNEKDNLLAREAGRSSGVSESANEDVREAVAFGCLLAASCQRRLAFSF